MKIRQEIIRALGIRGYNNIRALDFFLYLAERLKENLTKGLRIYIASRHLHQIMFRNVIAGGTGEHQYYRWTNAGKTEYIYKTQFFDIILRIKQQLNPDVAETKALYQFEPDDWHFLILSDLIDHILINGEENFLRTYMTQEPKANCIEAEITGQFYVAARPEDLPLVSEGEEVVKGQDVGVVVVNKTNNYIGAPCHCRITKVLVKNDTAVEAGLPLFEVIPILDEQE